MYVRVYARMYGIRLGLPTNPNAISNIYPMKSLVKQYITPENLKDAQDNTFNATNVNVGMKGVKGVYGEEVYGAQGLDKIMPGFDINDEATSV
jgi:hypothetical protein